MNSAFSWVTRQSIERVEAGQEFATKWEMARPNPPMQPLFAALGGAGLEAVERSVLSTFEQRAGGPDRPLHFDRSCHFLVARRACGHRVHRPASRSSAFERRPEALPDAAWLPLPDHKT